MNRIFKRLLLTIACFTTAFFLIPGIVSEAEESIYTPTHVVRKGSSLYYAYGNDGGGSIVRYNLKTQRSKTIAKGKFNHLNIRGNYIVARQNKYVGSDSTDNYIYRIQTNGKKKKLDKGMHPVIVGNKIYYIKQKKAKENNHTYDQTVGIYRMDMNGKHKTLIYRSSEVNFLTASKTTLYFYERGNKRNALDIATKTVTANPSMTGVTNTYRNYFLSTQIYCNVVINGWRYYASGSKLYKADCSSTQCTAIKYLSSFPGSIKEIINLNGKLIVVSENSMKAQAYVVNLNGKGKKKLTSWYLAGGGWM